MKARAALLLLAAALAAPGGVLQAQAPPAERAAWLQMFARSYYPGRSGQVMVVPREGDVLTAPSADVAFMHGSPWDYDARIPLVFWGEPWVRPGPRTEAATHQDVAPTLGHAVGLPLPGATGRVLEGALVPQAGAPRAVALLVLDGFRADYLDRHAALLPHLSRLRREGASFERARASVLPTITAVGHTTLATGADPRRHGVVANTLWDGVARARVEPFEGFSPDKLMVPALADLWSLETGGRAVIAAQSSSPSATALAGHGACQVGGRKVLYASYSWESGRWETNPRCYRLPQHLRGVEVKTLWEGTDGTWRGHPAATADDVRRTAPFARFEGDALVSTIEKEGVGKDEVPDLVLANLKVLDSVGHAWGPDSEEIREALGALDVQVGRIVAALVAATGPGGALVAVTADHGMAPEPPPGRARRYNRDVVALIHERLDPGKKLVGYYGAENAQVFLDLDRARELGVTVERVRDLLAEQPFFAAVFTEDEVRRARLP